MLRPAAGGANGKLWDNAVFPDPPLGRRLLADLSFASPILYGDFKAYAPLFESRLHKGMSVPTVSQFFQPPLYWQQFENLAHGLLGEVYSSPDAQQFGRPGQAQDGIDVFGRSKRYGMIGVQCKRLSDLDENGSPFPGGPITRKLLRQEAAKSLEFKSKLSIWILATTAPRHSRAELGE